MSSYSYPAPPNPMPPTAIDEVERIIARLKDKKAVWAATSLDQRLGYLKRILNDTLDELGPIIEKTQQSKGLESTHPCCDEDWLSFATVTMGCIRGLIQSYEELRDGGINIPGPTSTRSTGQIAVEAFPGRFWDRLTLPFFQGLIIMQPGVTRENLKDDMAVKVRNPPKDGKISFILGAGNQNAIPFTDALYKLFVESESVIIKLNPVNEYIGPHLRRAYKTLIDDGFFEVVYGGIEVGSHLCNHADVDTLHITGSDATHDAIVWGPRDGRDERKAKGERANDKPISSELGNVTPVIVTPGKWTARDMKVQAVNIVSMVTNNASFNCIAGKLLILPANWDQKNELLDAIRAELTAMPVRKAYYPGAQQRWQAFVDAHPKAERFGEQGPEVVPWTLITGLDPNDKDELCFTTEPFCAVLSVVELPSSGAADFLSKAVDFCNDVVWGTLSSTIIIHDRDRKDAVIEAALQEAIDEMRYGGIAINHWAGIPFGLPTLTWGAHPGHTLEDIGSGLGVVHNTLMFERPQKSVLFGPFKPLPKAIWNIDHTNAGAAGKALARFEQSPGLMRLLPVAWHAMKG